MSDNRFRIVYFIEQRYDNITLFIVIIDEITIRTITAN